jgi:DNA invertase Pin-like site-specific DNA recombinase
MRIGYARVSTREQNTDGQPDSLRAAGCERVYVDKASGKLGRRPEWDRCREQLRCDDALVVTKLDRMGRSVRHLIDVVGELDRAGVELVVLARASTPLARVGGCCSTCWSRWPGSSGT